MPLNAKVTRSRVSRRPHAQLTSSPRPVSSRARCSGIWRAATRKRQAWWKSTCTCSMNPVWRARNRCTRSWSVSDQTIEYCSPGAAARQHEAVDAGRPYRQLQEAGIRTAHLDEIVRQRDPELKAVVEQLSRGDVHGAVEQLDWQGRVHEIGPREERLSAIGNEYV